MRRASLGYSEQARRDLRLIARELGILASPRLAGIWVRRLRAKARPLAETPMMGEKIAEFGPGRRRLVEWPYVIVYEVKEPGRVTVVRILDGRRDLPSLFQPIGAD